MKTLNDIIWNNEDPNKEHCQNGEQDISTYSYGNQMEMCCTAVEGENNKGLVCR